MKGTPLNEELYGYIVDTFANEERALLGKMAARAAKEGLPMIMIAEDQARFLRVLLASMGAKRALDVGTLFGYSASIMALGMGSKGRVVSLELDPRNAAVARANLKEARLDRRVTIVEGKALESMKKLPSGSFDLALIDADKGGYVDYFDEALRLVRAGGIIAADNTLAWGQVASRAAGTREKDVRAIQRFNERVARSKEVDACLLAIGDGLVLARVKD